MTIQLPMKISNEIQKRLFHLNNLSQMPLEALSDGLPHHAKRPSRIEPEPEPNQQQVAVGDLGMGCEAGGKLDHLSVKIIEVEV